MSGKPISRNQARTITALLSKQTVAEAAEQAGVSERTIYRWLGEDNFKTALIEAEGDAIDAATRRLVAMQDEALKTIVRIMNLHGISPNAQLRAAQIALDMMIRLRELRNVEDRLAALEEVVYGQENSNQN